MYTRRNRRIGPTEILPECVENLVVVSNTDDDGDVPSVDECSLSSSLSLSSSSSSSSSRSHKSVKFDKVIVRKYEMTVGDNPSCSRGAPICLSWKYDPIHDEIPVDEYETYYSSRRKAKKISMEERHMMLVQGGVQLTELIEAIEECQRVMENRIETIVNLERKRPQVANKFLQAIINIFF
mmetsp:Transcript_8325/g.12533  ORF Transcript_8325/g.12533 Transcript_8325/m.12533 type:complete len:181 (-) Transcript_8325:131-673(-)